MQFIDEINLSVGSWYRFEDASIVTVSGTVTVYDAVLEPMQRSSGTKSVARYEGVLSLAYWDINS